MNWYQKDIDEVIEEFKTDPFTGLSKEEADKRRQLLGPNILPSKKKDSYFDIFLSQFKSILIFILLIASFLSVFLGDLTDALAIFTIVILNATIGAYQEVKAEKTLLKLKEKDIHYTLVLRDKQIEKIPARDVVPGDILILEEGEKISADGRVIESYALTIDESILSGESQPSNKSASSLKESDIPLPDRINTVFKDTQILAGRGKAVATEIGPNTEIGKITTILEEKETEKSPLALELDHLGKILSTIILIISAAIFVLTGFTGVPLIDRILISISLAVAAIPEGLPAIATITLALGVERLAKAKTVVKKLPAVETLGSIKIIATDKTGTLTENKLRAVTLLTPDGKHVDIEKANNRDFKNVAIEKLFTSAVLANNASLKKIDHRVEIIGDPTEGALLVASEKAGFLPSAIGKKWKRVYEFPFSEERKMMSVIVKGENGELTLFAKGAPEEILRLTSLPTDKKNYMLSQNDLFAQKGLRLLAFATKKLTSADKKNLLQDKVLEESGFTFLGIIAEKDSLRPGIKETIAQAQKAGIKTIIITGDHLNTAASIGLECGIITNNNQAITEDKIINLPKEQIKEAIINNKYLVFARVSPLTKLKIVESLKLIPDSHIAVTGDGVNDSPALKAAHVGLAMGSGTDAAREIADIVITDDNLATIISAIREGRIIFANLVKFIRYLLSCNLAEVIVVSLAVIIKTPLPLLPIQLLFINLITDGLPALALGADPPEYDVMQRPPRPHMLLHKRRWGFIITEAIIMGVSIFILYQFSLYAFSLETARTIAFSSLSISQLIHALGARSTRLSIFKLGIFTNMFLLLSITVSIFLQYAIVSSSFGHIIFKTTSLTSYQWVLVAFISVIPFIAVEIKKLGIKKLKI